MYQKDWTESTNATLMLDKNARKAYTGLRGLQTHLATFDKPLKSDKPKAVRTNVENAGGTVIWNPENNKATIKINGYTEDLYVGDGNGTFIQDGVMYTDDMRRWIWERI